MRTIVVSRAVVGLFAVAMTTVAATGLGAEVRDEFNDGVLDSAWSIEFGNADGATYSEAGTNFTVTDIAASIISHDGYNLTESTVILTRPVPSLGNFHADMTFSWSSSQSGYPATDALQKILLRLMSPAGEVVAFCGYSDPWIHYSGSRYWSFGEATGVGGQDSEPSDGSATVAINRVGSDIEMFWNGQPFVSGTNSTPISEVQVYFLHNGFDGAGGPSFFGTESVDSVNVVPEPTSLLLLAFCGVGMLCRRRRG